MASAVRLAEALVVVAAMFFTVSVASPAKPSCGFSFTVKTAPLPALMAPYDMILPSLSFQPVKRSVGAMPTISKPSEATRRA